MNESIIAAIAITLSIVFIAVAVFVFNHQKNFIDEMEEEYNPWDEGKGE